MSRPATSWYAFRQSESRLPGWVAGCLSGNSTVLQTSVSFCFKHGAHSAGDAARDKSFQHQPVVGQTTVRKAFTCCSSRHEAKICWDCPTRGLKLPSQPEPLLRAGRPPTKPPTQISLASACWGWGTRPSHGTGIFDPSANFALDRRGHASTRESGRQKKSAIDE